MVGEGEGRVPGGRDGDDPEPERAEPAGWLSGPNRGHGEPTGWRQALGRRRLWGEARSARTPWCPVGEGMFHLHLPDGAVGKDHHHLAPAAIPSWASGRAVLKPNLVPGQQGSRPRDLLNGQTPEKAKNSAPSIASGRRRLSTQIGRIGGIGAQSASGLLAAGVPPPPQAEGQDLPHQPASGQRPSCVIESGPPPVDLPGTAEPAQRLGLRRQGQAVLL